RNETRRLQRQQGYQGIDCLPAARSPRGGRSLRHQVKRARPNSHGNPSTLLLTQRHWRSREPSPQPDAPDLAHCRDPHPGDAQAPELHRGYLSDRDRAGRPVRRRGLALAIENDADYKPPLNGTHAATQADRQSTNRRDLLYQGGLRIAIDCAVVASVEQRIAVPATPACVGSSPKG